ncbi:alpha/beta hydrolase [Fructilactobacillus carniphilus]|uniref:Alpha/beta hydrolase n=1 Tax=Fructilactobacillus carniphilus TaxID=2940297 RepID=A0ABY5BY99_9LACO|nr:alpha/beta hydrolase [Fructilactobacillus carniphilus]USS90348.1 alpha/beta hydrolase [Fructilactobacillus carniphilus]
MDKVKQKRVWPRVLVVILIIVIVASGFAVYYLFNFAFQRGGFASQQGANVNTEFYDKTPSQTWTQKTKDGLLLKAHYFAAAQPTDKTVVVVHGYGSSARKMSSYIKMFHNDGYNVLAPDNRAFGKSQGHYVGYGWLDRIDLANWMKQLNEYNPHAEIGMFGVSMGAAEVMYTLPLAPKNVKFAIADCGYASINAELAYQLKTMFKLPSFPILPLANVYSKILAKYDFQRANTKQSLHKNQIPLFIIHGDKDQFVPTKFAYQNYRNNDGKNKQIWIVKGAGHAQARSMDPEEYQHRTQAFAEQWFNSRP